jgi:uncharacterized Tic20 family protein
MPELSAELLFILSLLSSVIVWLLKEAFVKKGKKVPASVYNIALGAVALLLALGFSPVVLPDLPAHDGSLIGILSAVLAFVGALLPVLVAVVGFAKIIYEALLKKVLEGLGEGIRKAIAGSDIG